MKKLLPLLFVFACGSDRPLTWGEAIETYINAACDAADICGRDFDVEACHSDSLEAACVDAKLCEIELPDAAEDLLDLCVYSFAQFDESDCNLFWDWGYQPGLCLSFLRLKPGRDIE